MVDGAYTGDDFADNIKDLVGAEVEVVKRSELQKFAVIPKRWIVERSFAWLDKCRLLWKNCERKLSSTLAFVKLAFLSVLLRRFKKSGNSYVKWALNIRFRAYLT